MILYICTCNHRTHFHYFEIRCYKSYRFFRSFFFFFSSKINTNTSERGAAAPVPFPGPPPPLPGGII